MKLFEQSFRNSARDGRLVPIVLNDSIKWLWQNGLRDNGLFIVEALSEKVLALMFRIEKGLYSSMYEESGIDSSLVTCLLKEFLRQLPDPLLTFAHFDKFIEWSKGPADVGAAAELLMQLPTSHLASIKALLPLLHEITGSKTAQMSAQDLALALGPTLLRPSDVAMTKGFPGSSVAAFEMLLVKWSDVAEALSQRERSDEGTPSTPTDGQQAGEPVSMFAFLDELGLLHRYDTFKQLGLSMFDLQQMAVAEFLEVGIDQAEAETLYKSLKKLVSSSSSAGASPSGGAAANEEEEWIEGELDPRVRKFLEKLGLDHLIALFDECQIDWVIMDMSAVSDFKELGLDEATIQKIMTGLGKVLKRRKGVGGGFFFFTRC